MFSAGDVTRFYTRLSQAGIQVWLTGGWGIDALLGRQTRPHHDLDLLVLLDDVPRICQLLSPHGFYLKEFWSENLWVSTANGNQVATAFVLRDAARRELDLHALRLDEQRNGIPAWNRDEADIFTAQDLAATGTVAGLTVQCITPQKQVFCHTGYPLPEKQVADLQLLCDQFGIAR